MFNFAQQKDVGDVGEQEFLAAYPDMVKLDGFLADFRTPDGETVELKTDTYAMKDTPNYFMEYFSNIDAKTIGGPWRAKRDNVTWFVYYFIKDKKFIWFKTEQLVNKLNVLIGSELFLLTRIQNTTHTTAGYKIPRRYLDSISN